MTDTFKPIGDGNTRVTPDHAYTPPAQPPNDAGRALLAGLVGGLASAVGYIVYSRLPEEQKERLQAQGRALAESRINEVRSRLNI